MAVLPRREAGADADDDGRVADPHAEVALGENRVDERIRPQRFAAGACRIGEHGDLPRRENFLRLRGRCRRARRHVLDRGRAQHKRLREADRAADGRGLFEVGHHHVQPRAVQPQGDAGGEIPRAANQNSHASRSLRLFFKRITPIKKKVNPRR